jgi:hypothetical protein
MQHNSLKLFEQHTSMLNSTNMAHQLLVILLPWIRHWPACINSNHLPIKCPYEMVHLRTNLAQ